MNITIERKMSEFGSITLEHLNSKAAMLERLDNKYVLSEDKLGQALHDFAQHFDALEIDGRRAFTYATRYYDDADLRAYYDHHQGRRKRCKVRVRDYVEAGLLFLEIKLKDHRQITVKKRLRLDDPADANGPEARAFIDASHREIYGEDFGRPLAPGIGVRYRRITLVAREGGERMTIDTALSFDCPERSRMVDPRLCIIETKSARGNGIADKILRALHVHPTERCSKYCVGMAALDQVDRRNRFLPALRRLALVGPSPVLAE